MLFCTHDKEGIDLSLDDYGVITCGFCGMAIEDDPIENKFLKEFACSEDCYIELLEQAIEEYEEGI